MRYFLLLCFVCAVFTATLLGGSVARCVRNDSSAPMHCLFLSMLLVVLAIVFTMGIAHS